MAWFIHQGLNDTNMNVLNLLCQTIVDLFKGLWLLPHTLAVALEQRRQRFALDALEAERLDRIRNPGKYLGK